MTQDTLTRDIELGRDGAAMSPAVEEERDHGRDLRTAIEAFERAERDPDIGALVVSGKGGVFTAGDDIGDFLAVTLREQSDFSMAVCEQARRVRKAVDRGD
jgi:hypothetical protein